MIELFKGLVLRLVIFYLQVVFGWTHVWSYAWGFVFKGPWRMLRVEQPRSRPVVLDDEGLGEHNYARLKNATLHYVSKGPVDAPLMVFLHGFPQSWYSWRHQIKEYSTNYRVVAVDMKGYGESSKPTHTSAYSMTRLVEDIREFIQHLTHEQCKLVGHDWGGLVAWTLATTYPSLVDKLILINAPHPRAFQMHMFRSPTQILKSGYTFAFQWPVLPEMLMRQDNLCSVEESLTAEGCGAKSGTHTELDIAAFKYNFTSFWDMVGPINYYRCMWQRYEDFGKARTPLSCPTLMIWGDKDAWLHTSLAETSAQYAKDYTVKYVRERSHWVHEEEPEIVNTHIHEFLNLVKLE